MLRFAKSVPYLPDPARSRAHITDAERARAAEVPPHAVPFHCKPWMDGQTLGWTLSYGFLTDVEIHGQEEGSIRVENLENLALETNQARIVDQFAQGHFGLGSGYTLVTPPGFVLLILPPTSPPANLDTVAGVIESDWYPRQIFLVFRVPAPGRAIHLTRGASLARVVVMPRHDEWEAKPLTPAELDALREREAAYLQDERETDSRWIAASGDSFTHVYRQWSARQRREDAR